MAASVRVVGVLAASVRFVSVLAASVRIAAMLRGDRTAVALIRRGATDRDESRSHRNCKYSRYQNLDKGSRTPPYNHQSLPLTLWIVTHAGKPALWRAATKISDSKEPGQVTASARKAARTGTPSTGS